MRTLHCLIVILFTSSLMYGSKIVDGEYHSVKARPGDGIDVLLQRYELLQEASLKTAFAKLNKLSPDDYLMANKAYVLPVVLYNYNGRSIRTTINNDDWDNAVAIQEYNETLLAKGVRATHFKDSKILWVPLHLNGGNTGSVKPSSAIKEHIASTSTLDVYGPGNKITKIIDHQMKGKVVYVVAGHGGPDPGAMCKDCASQLCEDEYAYDVALRLARQLEEHGAIVEMVIQDKNDGIRSERYLKCDRDETLADGSKIPYKHITRLQQRTNYINRKYSSYQRRGIKDQVVISIHIDSNSKSTKQDVFFCYAKGSKASKALAADMSVTFAEKYQQHQKNRGYNGYLHERRFYVLRKTSPPAVLIELANIRNKNDHKRILLESNRQALANWIYDGLVNHFDLPPAKEEMLANN